MFIIEGWKYMEDVFCQNEFKKSDDFFIRIF